MELPVTPKPMPASSPNLPTKHYGMLFGIVSPLVVGIARKKPSPSTPENNRPAAQDLIPDTTAGWVQGWILNSGCYIKAEGRLRSGTGSGKLYWL
ncbi:hypothetical protein DSO57_1011182 [Entomophthora muscae]|uniref:Uncharacterized protein n=1 Tax=Entomophthora muscae TaxID=34485 RepID=A0ACC2UFR7_9FUNG|nr:hypothetical protein DSO57_1011182 [Entomophthora muscae]